jgi:leader peptidase (prepilin peptidase)/N-methyltransferase
MDQLDFLHQLLLGPFGRVAACLWGAVWGSFFNVLIVRLPGGESVIRPASRCPSCSTPIRWYDNIPVLSYLVLRGRCRHCSARISFRYVLVELVVCLLSALMHQIFVVQGAGDLGLRMAQFVITSLFSGVLVAITFIDLDTFLIPDAITYPGIPICMLLSLFMGNPHLWDGVVGGVGGYLIIRIIADGYRLLTGRRGMGYGDAKLLAMIGALMGWQVLLPTLFLAAFQGSLIGITLLVIMRATGAEPAQTTETDEEQGEEEEEEEEEDQPSSLRHAKIPFGPFLSLAAIEFLLLRDWLIQLFPYLW